MLDDRDMLYTLGLVAFLLVATVSYNNMKAKEERQRKESGDGPGLAEAEEDGAMWLSKFAVQSGSVVGETVSIDEGRLILKQAGVYKAVPMDKARLHGDEVIVSDGIDWDDAQAQGSAWLAANTKGQDDAVTSELTRSEDVRAPALEALEARGVDAPRHPPGLSEEE